MSIYEQAITGIVNSYERARASGRRNMNAMSLATVSADGLPSLRTVLFKVIDSRGLLFFTDQRSRKGQYLSANPRASACIYWEPIEEQVRFDGRIEKADPATVAEDFRGRPRAAQILIHSSTQSAALPRGLSELRKSASEKEAQLPKDIPVPAHWQGYWLAPDYIETWVGARDRLHARTAYAYAAPEWSMVALQP